MQIRNDTNLLFRRNNIIVLFTVIKQGQRNDLKVKTNEKENIKSGLKECAEKFHMSERQISRYIRIPNCCSEIKQMLDNKKILLRAAVELSFNLDDTILLYSILNDWKFR